MDDQEMSQKFTSGNEISFSMTATTPEQHLFFKEWSAIVPTFYMLDICVVGATKLTNEFLAREPRKAKLVEDLRFLDRPTNCFSYLFALMEKVSDSRGKDSDEELEEKILSDLSSMRGFFKSARVHETDEYVITFLKELRGRPIESKRSDYLEFIDSLNNQFKLGNSVGAKQRLETAKEILIYADSLSINRQHPVVSIALACLYGNIAAKKLMKFKVDQKKFNASNALADIMLISRFASTKLEIEEMGRNGVGYPRSIFITDDDGLIKILKCFKAEVVEHTDKNDGRETKLTMTMNFDDLLTEIEQPESELIQNLLNLT